MSSRARIVAALTPVFTAVAAVGAAWLARHFPGLPPLSSGELGGAGAIGAASAIGASLTWLRGHSAWERAALSDATYFADKVGLTQAELRSLLGVGETAVTEDKPTVLAAVGHELDGITAKLRKLASIEAPPATLVTAIPAAPPVTDAEENAAPPPAAPIPPAAPAPTAVQGVATVIAAVPTPTPEG